MVLLLGAGLVAVGAFVVVGGLTGRLAAMIAAFLDPKQLTPAAGVSGGVLGFGSDVVAGAKTIINEILP